MGFHPLHLSQSDTSSWRQLTSAFGTFGVWAVTVLFVFVVQGYDETENIFTSPPADISANVCLVVARSGIVKLLIVIQLWTTVLIVLVCHRSTLCPAAYQHSKCICQTTLLLSGELVDPTESPRPSSWRRRTTAAIGFRTFWGVCVAAAGCCVGVVVEGHDEAANTTAAAAAAVDSAPYKDFKLSVEGWVIVLSCVVLFWVLLSIVLACFCANTSQECHLCEQPVPSKLWQSGKHMKTCAAEHERYLHDLPGTKIGHLPKQTPKCLWVIKRSLSDTTVNPITIVPGGGCHYIGLYY